MRRSDHRILVVSAVAAGSVALLASIGGPARAAPLEAQARLKTAGGVSIGTVTFRDDPKSAETIIRVNVRVPPVLTSIPTFHGLHVHANDNAANGVGCVADPAALPSTWFVSADGHYKHTATEVHGSHAGDLPSIHLNADGTGEMRTTKDGLSPTELVGKVVILHAGPDNFGNVPVGGALDQYTANAADAVTKTQATGNAGDRFACGVIALT